MLGGSMAIAANAIADLAAQPPPRAASSAPDQGAPSFQDHVDANGGDDDARAGDTRPPPRCESAETRNDRSPTPAASGAGPSVQTSAQSNVQSSAKTNAETNAQANTEMRSKT